MAPTNAAGAIFDVNCVEVLCNSDQALNGSITHKLVQVPISHRVFDGDGEVSEVSKLIHMPLVTLKYAPRKYNDGNNPRISYMHINCALMPTADESFGLPKWAYLGIDRDPGTHLVARLDKQHLDCETVEAFNDFCQHQLMSLFQGCNELMEDEESSSPRLLAARQALLDGINPAVWANYLMQWKAEKQDAAAAAARGVPPYTVEKAKMGPERKGVTKDDSDRLDAIQCGFHKSYIRGVEQRIARMGQN